MLYFLPLPGLALNFLVCCASSVSPSPITPSSDRYSDSVITDPLGAARPPWLVTTTRTLPLDWSTTAGSGSRNDGTRSGPCPLVTSTCTAGDRLPAATGLPLTSCTWLGWITTV